MGAVARIVRAGAVALAIASPARALASSPETPPVAVGTEVSPDFGPAPKPAPLPIPPGLPDEPLRPMDVAYQGLAGARAAFSHAGGAGSERNGMNAMFGLVVDAFLRWGHLDGHLGLDATLGGGGAGFEGGLGGTLLAGYRLDLGPQAGLFARLGGDARFAGNDRWYDSRLVLPELEIGGQVLRSPNVIDVGAYAGAVLTGRARIDGDDRRLDDALAYGGRLSVRQGLGFGQLDLGWTTPSQGFHDQAFSARARACLTLGPLAFCVDGRVLTAHEVRFTSEARETAEEIGLSAGAGF